MNIYTLSQDLKDHPTRTLRTTIIWAESEASAIKLAENTHGGEWYVTRMRIPAEKYPMIVHTYTS